MSKRVVQATNRTQLSVTVCWGPCLACRCFGGCRDWKCAGVIRMRAGTGLSLRVFATPMPTGCKRTWPDMSEIPGMPKCCAAVLVLRHLRRILSVASLSVASGLELLATLTRLVTGERASAGQTCASVLETRHRLKYIEFKLFSLTLHCSTPALTVAAKEPRPAILQGASISLHLLTLCLGYCILHVSLYPAILHARKGSACILITAGLIYPQKVNTPIRIHSMLTM